MGGGGGHSASCKYNLSFFRGFFDFQNRLRQLILVERRARFRVDLVVLRVDLQDAVSIYRFVQYPSETSRDTHQ